MRTHRIEIRLNSEELATLNARRGALRLRTFIRVAVLDSAPPVIPSINRDALAELHRVGSNLNQIARKLNTTGEPVDLRNLRAQVSDLRAALAGAQT